MLDLNGTADMIAKVKAMIVDDAESGLMPWQVPDFSALHDYRDANEYLIQAGQVYEPDDPASIAEINLIEDAVSVWLELGRLADMQPVRVSWLNSERYELVLPREEWRDRLGGEHDTPMTIDTFPVDYLTETPGRFVGIDDRVVDEIEPMGLPLHDPDDVADLVAHDVAAGLPGFTPAGPDRGTGAWAWQVLGAMTGDERAAASTICEMVAVALAYRTEARGPETDWVPLAATVISALVDSAHGPGVAHEADTLLRWWRGLTDEERALTGIELDGTCQFPGEAS